MEIDFERGRRLLRATYREYLDDQVSIVASGVAFRVTLAIFPAVALLVWIGLHTLGPKEAEALSKMFASVLPDSSRQVVQQAIHSSTRNNPANGGGSSHYLGALAPLAGLAFMIYSANRGMQSLFNALNIIYDIKERRGVLRFTAVTLLFTFGTLAGIAATTAIIVAAPTFAALLAHFGIHLAGFQLLRWPALFLVVAGGLSLLYRYAPNREREEWPIVTIGSTLAALLIVLVTALFSWFTRNFASLAVTYGSLSTIVAFMLWLWANFWIALVCAELDACLATELSPNHDDAASSQRS